MSQFRDRRTNMIHTTLVSPDGGMVNGVHNNLEEAHNWARSAMEVSRAGSPPAHGAVETWRHNSDATGEMLGVGQVHSHASHYYPATRSE